MSKAAALGATGVLGTGGAALVGAHQLGAFGNWDDYIETTTAQLATYNGQCLDKTFGKDKWEIPDINTIPAFTKINVLLTKATKGCLAINWDKEKKSIGDWEGKFRFVWTSFNGLGMGFVLYLSGITEDAGDGKVNMKFEGVTYYINAVTQKIGNEEEIVKYKATKKLSLKNQGTQITHSELATKFPVLGDTLLKTKPGLDGYMDFLDNSKTKIKPAGKGKKAHWYARWVLKEGGTDPVDPWKANTFDKWWSHFFDKETWDLNGTVSYLKGKWELETISG